MGRRPENDDLSTMSCGTASIRCLERFSTADPWQTQDRHHDEGTKMSLPGVRCGRETFFDICIIAYLIECCFGSSTHVVAGFVALL